MRARVAGALTLASILAAGCAGRSAPAPGVPVQAAPAPTPAVVAAVGPVSEAEFLALEDRRLFDPARLGAAARHDSAGVRSRAALALGRIGDERAVPLLDRLAGDRAADVRLSAAFAAGILGEPALTAALSPRLGDADPAVAARAAWALSMLEQPAGADALLAALRTAAPERRAPLLRALWRFRTPEAASAASAFASDADPAVRSAALYALARRPQEVSLATLTAALADPDADTAALCARALELLAKPESIGPLSAAAAGSRAPVTIAALLALQAVLEKNEGAALPDDETARLLALSGDTNPNLAVPALALLRWRAAEREVFRRLWTVASSGRGRRQQVALTALMAGLSDKARDLVDAAMASPDPYLRGTVAESLSYLPAADAAARRARLAADPEVVVRLKLLEGLRTKESVAQNRALVDAALNDSDPGVQAAAIDALAQLEDPAVWPVIQDAVTRSSAGPAPDVAIEAIAAAEAHPADPAARAVVEAAYRHSSVLVSRLARRSLVKRFHADPAAFPWRAYEARSADDYAQAAASEREARPPVARIETERGAFTLRLAPRDATLTVGNFLALARRGYFDGVRIHRVAPGFVVQDGDPTGTGNGGPGYEIRDELNPTPYDTGTVGMALSGPDTGGSQWFVTQAPQPHLDGGYTVFGRVIAGMDVVARIEQGDRIQRVTLSEGSR
jgi:cyclophilin family peptidyl-prolyl cis-trans isomerase/HEAT repeat protein